MYFVLRKDQIIAYLQRSGQWTLIRGPNCVKDGYYLHICVLFFLARTGRPIIFFHAGADFKVSNTRMFQGQSFVGGTFEGQLVRWSV